MGVLFSVSVIPERPRHFKVTIPQLQAKLPTTGLRLRYIENVD